VADNVKLLVVDDNPMVLGMLQQALAPLAKVTTATDAADRTADMTIAVRVHDLGELEAVLARIAGLPDVLRVQRR
jgi:(p)ppGpp synthase/HD superfamily hydrolase